EPGNHARPHRYAVLFPGCGALPAAWQHARDLRLRGISPSRGLTGHIVSLTSEIVWGASGLPPALLRWPAAAGRRPPAAAAVAGRPACAFSLMASGRDKRSI